MDAIERVLYVQLLVRDEYERYNLTLYILNNTSTTHSSLYKIPLIIAYKINFLTHFIVKRMIKIKYANLLNLIANREIIPELLQEKCNANLIFEKILGLIENKDCAQKQIDEANNSLEILGLNNIKNPMNLAVNEILKL
jgi:lipid-A-disaccharide synthase